MQWQRVKIIKYLENNAHSNLFDAVYLISDVCGVNPRILELTSQNLALVPGLSNALCLHSSESWEAQV